MNPDRVRSQMEGACVMGVAIATLGEIFKGGRVEQDNFNSYEVTRMAQAQRMIGVHIIPGDYSQPMGGVGKPGATHPTGALHRDLCRKRQTHLPAADPRSAEGVALRWMDPKSAR